MDSYLDREIVAQHKAGIPTWEIASVTGAAETYVEKVLANEVEPGRLRILRSEGR